MCIPTVHMTVNMTVTSETDYTHIQHREYNRLEERARFIKRPFQALVVLHIQFLVDLDVLPDSI